MFVHFLLDEVLDAVGDLIRSQRFLNDHLLEHVQFLLPFPGERYFSWVFVSLDHLKLLQIIDELVFEAFEAFDCVQTMYILVDSFPGHFVDPRWTRRHFIHFVCEPGQEVSEVCRVDVTILDLQFNRYVEAEE